MKTDSKKSKQSEWYNTHVLMPDQVKKLIEAKFERARVMYEAEKRREALTESR